MIYTFEELTTFDEGMSIEELLEELDRMDGEQKNRGDSETDDAAVNNQSS